MCAESAVPSWGIVATIDEPTALTAAWVAYHLSIGANEIHFFLDRPNPETEALLRGLDRVFIHLSGDDGWRDSRRQSRPGRHQARQAYNATRILQETRLDWLIHCDADEFLRLSAPLEDELAQVPDSVEWLHLEVEERVWTGVEADADIFDGAFRSPIADFGLIGPGLYGPERAERMNAGLSGHNVGKACVRSGRGHVLNIHRPASHRGAKRCDLKHQRCQHARLTHFNGMTRLHYIMKMLRRGLVLLDGQMSPSSTARKLQFQSALSAAADADVLTRLWKDMQHISPEEVEMLAELDAMRFGGLDIGARAEEVFSAQPNLDPASFDRALIAHEREALEELALRVGFAPDLLIAE